MKALALKSSLALVALLGAAAGTALGIVSERRLLAHRRARVWPPSKQRRRPVKAGAARARAILLDDSERALLATERLLSDGCPRQCISLLMSERTAKDLSVNAGPPAARALRTLPGTDLSGAGPALDMLARAGLGPGRNLVAALTSCGVDPETAATVARQLRAGGVLLVVPESLAECMQKLELCSRELVLAGDATLLDETPTGSANRPRPA
jgi:hypothetical protein